MQNIIIPVVPKRRHCPPHDVGSVDGFPFQLAQPDNTDYILGYDWPWGGKIAALRITASLGSGHVSVLINDQVVTGLDTVPVNANTRGEINAEDLNSFQPGDDIILRVDDGAGSLLNVVGTLVITNRSIFSSAILSPTPWIQSLELAFDSSLAGQTVIPVTISPALKRDPFFIFNATIVKNDPAEDSVFSLNYEPFEAGGDFMSGWNYILSNGAVLGQVMRWGYIP